MTRKIFEEQLRELYRPQWEQAKTIAQQHAYQDVMNEYRPALENCIQEMNQHLARLDEVHDRFIERFGAELKYLAVDIAEKILRPLWQLQDRAEIDDLRNGGLPVGKFPGKQSEIGCVFHRNSFLCKMLRLLLPPSYNERGVLRTGSGKASEKNKNL